MKQTKKPVFFIVFALIIAFAASVIFGFSTQYGDVKTTYIKSVQDIRLGVDIQGGVDVTFVPADGVDATTEQLDSVTEVIEQRLTSLNINDYEVYEDDANDRVIVRFPWQAGEEDFDPEAAVKELGETAVLSFRIGTGTNEDGTPAGDIVLQGNDIENAEPMRQENQDGTFSYVVSLELTDQAAEVFSTVTSTMAGTGEAISIWMDDEMISAPTVNEAITGGQAVISGDFSAESAKSLADKINAGALPFNLETSSFKTISPTLGTGALEAMIISAIIAFAFIFVYMLVLYKIPGFVASIAIIGQVAVTLACISGWFGFNESSTLTIPGIAGIILAVGMGVDANIITGERIKEELNSGKSLDTALRAGYKRAFSSILDGNLTSLIVAVILMAAFGTPDSFLASWLNKLLSLFGIGATTEGVIYSFGFTLLVGTILNFVMGVFASRLMVTSLSRFKFLRNKKFYGGASNE
ncbi:MAG: SecD/SecF family protein translocase subunit [Ruminococcus sp.]|nr:SecD/SecF family protein translocase subunit [Ruminococcus sp.]